MEDDFQTELVVQLVSALEVVLAFTMVDRRSSAAEAMAAHPRPLLQCADLFFISVNLSMLSM